MAGSWSMTLGNETQQSKIYIIIVVKAFLMVQLTNIMNASTINCSDSGMLWPSLCSAACKIA